MLAAPAYIIRANQSHNAAPITDLIEACCRSLPPAHAKTRSISSKSTSVSEQKKRNFLVFGAAKQKAALITEMGPARSRLLLTHRSAAPGGHSSTENIFAAAAIFITAQKGQFAANHINDLITHAASQSPKTTVTQRSALQITHACLQHCTHPLQRHPQHQPMATSAAHGLKCTELHMPTSAASAI
jgi:hypothetical protein